MTRHIMRRPRTTTERRAACAAEADRDEGAPGLLPRLRPPAWDDLLIAASGQSDDRVSSARAEEYQESTKA